jgi:hypothetical protein
MEYGNVDTKAKALELTGLPWKKQYLHRFVYLVK